MRSTAVSLVCVLVSLAVSSGLPAWSAPALDPRSGAEETELSAHDGATGDAFGRSVAMSGDTAVVGATGDQDDGPYSGSAYVFQRDLGGPDSWGQVRKLTASDATAEDRFGTSIAISTDTVVVGAPGRDVGSTSPGYAYVFSRDHGGADNWGQLKKITASDAAKWDGFGTAVAISGDTAVVSAAYNDDHGTNSGSVYVFRQDLGGPDNWGEVTKITASDAADGDDFGIAVAIWDDTVVVGTTSDGIGYHAGSGYVFQRDHGGNDSWGEVAKLTASDAAANDLFGYSVAIWGDRVVVGAVGNEVHGSHSGSAYLFHRHEGGVDSWGEVAKFTASDTTIDDCFGSFVSACGDYVLVGASGVNTGTGSAYVYFSFPADEPGTPFCFGDRFNLRCPCFNDAPTAGRGCANSTGDGCRLLGWGSNSLGQQTVDPLVLSVIGSRPSQPGLYFGGSKGVNDGLGLRFGDGLRCVGGGLVRFEIVFASSNGSCSTSVPIATVMGVAPGDVRRFQFWYRDPGPGSPCGNEFNLSNGYEVRFLP